MDGPDLLAARLVRALLADDQASEEAVVREIQDSPIAGIVSALLGRAYVTELLKTAKRQILLSAVEARILELSIPEPDEA